MYNAMISLTANSGASGRNHTFHKGMYVVGCTPDTVTYNTLISLYKKNLMSQEALALLLKMHNTGCIPDAISSGS